MISLTISTKLQPASSLCLAAQTDSLGNSECFCERVEEELLIRPSFSVNFCPCQQSLAFTSCKGYLKLPARASAGLS